ncbi:MAG: PAS domain S-box protein [Thermomicrobiales bacterium]
MLRESGPKIQACARTESLGTTPPTTANWTGERGATLEASLNALVIVDANGIVDGWNASAEEMFDLSQQEARGRRLVDLIIPPEHREAHEHGMHRYLQTGESEIINKTVEVQAMRRDGERFPALLTVSNMPGDGEPKFLGALRDISWQLAAESERREIEERFRTLVEQLPVVVFIDAADAHMTPLYVSPQIEQMLGYSQEEWLADPDLWLKSLHPEDRDEVCELALSWQFGPPFEHEYRLISKDGRIVWIREETVTVFDDHGAPRFSQGIFVDITSQKEIEERIRKAEARYRSLVEQTPAITFRTASESLLDVRYVSPQIEAILGYTAGEWIANQGIFWSGIHPEDRERCEQAIRESHESGKPLSLEYRQRARSGRYVWLSVTTDLVRDDAGQPSFWQGVFIDVTDRRTMEDAYSSLRDRYRHFADHANDAIIAIDLQGQFLFANPAFHKMSGYGDEELSRMKLSDMVAPSSFEHARDIALRLLSGSQISTDHESLVLRTRDGNTLIVELSASVVRANREPIGFQAILRDVTDRARLEAELEHQAYHDPLTDLPNRARLLEQLWRALDSEDGETEENAVIFLDLDNFKVINDSLGHDIGDLALVEVGQRIRHCLREGDFVARFGGDEFVILLKGLNHHVSAADIAQRIVNRFDDPLEIAGREVKITASIGIAEFSRDIERPEELLRRADLAMYRSKERGRNRYELHDERMDRVALDRLELETDLRWAIEHDQLSVDYQPVVDASSGVVSGAEALVRWVHPRRDCWRRGSSSRLPKNPG